MSLITASAAYLCYDSRFLEILQETCDKNTAFPLNIHIFNCELSHNVKKCSEI